MSDVSQGLHDAVCSGFPPMPSKHYTVDDGTINHSRLNSAINK